MKKHLGIAAAVGIGAAAVTAAAVHGYLDVMYKETIPPSIFKRIANKNGFEGSDAFAEFTHENCKWIEQQDIEIIDMKNADGFVLKGYYLPAEEKTDKFVLFAHGYRADHNGDPANFERFYHEQGYNFMSVDHVTAGDSEGDFLGFDYFEARDFLQWVDYLVNRFGENIKIVLHGVSMGGATVCKTASAVPPQVKAIVSDCAYTSAEDEFAEVAKGVGISKTTPLILKVFNAMNKRLAHFDLKETDVRESVKNARVPMLFVHGSADKFVPTKMCYEMYDICTAPKDMLIVDGAFHAQSIMVNGDLYKDKLKEFLGKYI